MSLVDAVNLRITRLRKPEWANPFDHVQIHITPDERLGLWMQLYCPYNIGVNGRDPVEMLTLDGRNDKVFVPYTGPLPDSVEYKMECAAHNPFNFFAVKFE